MFIKDLNIPFVYTEPIFLFKKITFWDSFCYPVLESIKILFILFLLFSDCKNYKKIFLKLCVLSVLYTYASERIRNLCVLSVHASVTYACTEHSRTSKGLKSALGMHIRYLKGPKHEIFECGFFT